MLLCLTVLAAASVYDIKYGIIPNRVTLPASVSGIILCVLRCCFYGNTSALAAGLSVCILLLAFSFTNWLGAGDIRLLMAVALIKGVLSMLGSVCIGSLLVIIAAIAKGRARQLRPVIRVSYEEYLRASNADSFVFSPFLLTGFVLSQAVLYLITGNGFLEWI